MRRRAWWIAVVLAACSGDDVAVVDAPLAIDAPLAVDARTPDAAPPDAPGLQACLAIRQEWRARVALLDESCDAPEDCVAVGGAPGASCLGGYLMLPVTGSDCSGVPVNRAAYEQVSVDIEALATSFYACMGGTQCPSTAVSGCVTDCITGSQLVCAGNRCALQPRFSCPPVIDGGVDAG